MNEMEEVKKILEVVKDQVEDDLCRMTMLTEETDKLNIGIAVGWLGAIKYTLDVVKSKMPNQRIEEEVE